MNWTEAELKQYQEIINRKYGQSLSLDDANDQVTKVYRLFKLIQRCSQ